MTVEKHSARVLIVEDELIIAREVREALRDFGYEPAGVLTSGEEVLQRVEDIKPDVVLMDIFLEGPMDGVETANRIRELLRIPVIFLSAHSNSDLMERVKSTEPFAYLQKPLNREELHAAIEIGLYKSRMERLLRESEARFRAVVEDQTELICRITPEGTVTFANEALAAHVGLDRESVIGKNIDRLLGSDFNLSSRRIDSMTSDSPACIHETRCENAGEERRYEWRIRAITDPLSQGVREFQMVGRDVTEQRRLADAHREMNLKLESIVKERTAELRRTNELLREEIAGRKAREEALKESESRVRAMYENPDVVMLLIDPETGRIEDANPGACRFYGYDRDRMCSMTIMDINCLPPGQIRSEMSSARLRNRRMFRFPHRLADGKIREVQVCSSPVQVAGKQLLYSIVYDITELEQIQKALEESEQLLSDVFESIQDGISILDRDMNIIRVNPTMEGWYAHGAPLTGQRCYRVLHGKDRPCEDCPSLAALETGSTQHRIRPKLGSRRERTGWLEVYSFPLKKRPDGELRGVIEYVRDVTDRVRMEAELRRSNEELESRVAARTVELSEVNTRLQREIAERAGAEKATRESEARFRAIFETASDCIYILDRSLRFTLVNPATINLLEIPEAGIVGKTEAEVFGAEPGRHAARVCKRVLEGEVIEEEQTRPVRGNPMTFLDVRAPMRDDHGRIIGICCISRNITERRLTFSTPVMQHSDTASPVMAQTLKRAEAAAGIDSIVLLLGETGSGKDYLARYIHDRSKRAGGPFFSINCAALTPDLAESELFGHEAGSFTGAQRRKRGMLELAEGGTLLLNEIGELSPALQAKLLTFLDTRSFTRVGGEESITVDARLMAATNRDLEEEVSNGRFREDLYYRLNVLTVRVPSLREKPEDIEMLSQTMLQRLHDELQLTRTPKLHPRGLETLKAYSWPGNVRELRNVLERALILAGGRDLDGEIIQAQLTASPQVPNHLPVELSLPLQKSLTDTIRDLKRTLIERALQESGGKRIAAAKLLGISRDALKSQMRSLFK